MFEFVVFHFALNQEYICDAIFDNSNALSENKLIYPPRILELSSNTIQPIKPQAMSKSALVLDNHSSMILFLASTERKVGAIQKILFKLCFVTPTSKRDTKISSGDANGDNNASNEQMTGPEDYVSLLHEDPKWKRYKN